MTEQPVDWQDGHFIAGDVALDFANTVFRRTPELGRDLLSDTDVLHAWFRRTGIVAVDGEPDDPGDALAEARGLRALLWELFDARAAGDELPGAALAAVLDVAGRGLARGGVRVGPQGSPTACDLRDGCAAVAVHALRLLLSVAGPPVRGCGRCGWFFLDTSRGRRRRWCDMKTCGNQAKAARHRATHD